MNRRLLDQSDSDQVIAYSKREGDNLILVVVNLDPFKAIETLVHWNLSALGLEDKAFEVTDLIDQAKYSWGSDTFIRLDPTRPMGRVAHIARVKK